MNFTQLISGATLIASATAAGAATPSMPGSSKALAPTRAASSIRLEYTDFTKLYGDRAVLTANSVLGTGQATRFSISLSEGQRRGGGVTTRATGGTLSVDHDWSSRLSSRTTVSAATNGAVFAQYLVGQDISYKVTDRLVGTVGGKFASYGNRNNVTTWSAGLAYYLRGATISYRYSLLASRNLGRSSSHLGSVRIKDPGGNGATQLWVGHGSSLFDVNLPNSANGRFTSVSLQRSQPIGGGVSLTFGADRAWYRTPTGSYRGTGLVAGLSFSNWPL